MNLFRHNLKSFREQKGVSQKKLADIFGVTQQAVAKWENGKAEPDTETLKKLAEYFKVSLDELLGLEFPKSDNLTYPHTQAAHAVEGTPITEEALNVIEAELKKIREELKRNKEK